MKIEKSKKDLAFDKERAKYRSEIKTLQHEIKENFYEIERLNQKISKLEDSIRQKDDWINRLLEYMDLSEEDISKKVREDRLSDLEHEINRMNNVVLNHMQSFLY